jgi:hypothetical protein
MIKMITDTANSVMIEISSRRTKYRCINYRRKQMGTGVHPVTPGNRSGADSSAGAALLI